MAAKLQYPDMQSAVEADVNQLKIVFQIHARMDPAVDTTEILKEIAARCAKNSITVLRPATRGFTRRSGDAPDIRVPEIVPELSTKRLLTMTWLEGRPLLQFKQYPVEDRNTIARAMFRAWWFPFSH